MKKAPYRTAKGKRIWIEYDETAPCRVCGFPVMDASMGGVDLCPWCDCGHERPEIKEAKERAFEEVGKSAGDP